uniref:DnaJ subfamily B member 14 n=2 Tax=Lygus hesperus TaxID=30085 RepID=A0A0A9XT75_LYGHE
MRSGKMDYTHDQLEAVRRVEYSQNYYEILEVSKEASDDDIKKAYKKLVLQLHPDKNNAPGAADAFKAVVNASEMLSTEEKRRKYDAMISQQQGMMDMGDLQGLDWLLLGVGAGLSALAGYMLYKSSQSRSKK